MPAPSLITGAIRLEPLALGSQYGTSDDSLELLLESFAHCHSLADAGEVRIVASTRFSRLTAGDDPAIGVRANLAQLVDDLQTEYDELAERLAS